MSKSRTGKKRLSKEAKKEARAKVMNVLLNIWLHIRIVIDYVIDFVFGWYYDGKLVKIPAAVDKVVCESAVDIAASIRKGERRAVDVLNAYIQRIEAVNGIINAVTDRRFETALEEAKQIDSDIAEGKIDEVTWKKKPFLGVPFSTKESTACKGLLHSFGIVSRKGMRAEEDADVIKLMKEAGAILIVNTNIPEFNLWQETRNNVYGQTLNPYNTTRTTGGSSGGEAALIAACGTGFGIGTDIGGSIRMPAFFCGIFGHKPTSYLISTKGLSRRTGKEKHTMVVAGPMSRHAKDLAPLLKVLVGSNIDKLKLDTPVDISSLKYFYVEESKDARASSICVELRQLMRRVVNGLIDESPDVEDKVINLEVPDLQYSTRLWLYWMTQEPSKFAYELANREGEVSAWAELLKTLIGQSQFSLAAVLKLVADKLFKENEQWAQEVTASLRRQLLEILGDNGVLLYPSYTWPASFHYTAFLRPFNFSYWCIFNVLQFPVTQVPLGLSQDGLPMGIQVVSAPYNDHLCIAVAQYLEKSFGGFVPPFQ